MAPPGGSSAWGGRRGSFVTRTEKSGFTAFHPLLLLAPAASSVLWQRLSQKFVPGHEPLVVGESSKRNQRPAAPRARRGSSLRNWCRTTVSPSRASCTQSHRAHAPRERPTRRSGGSEGLRAATSRGRSKVAPRRGKERDPTTCQLDPRTDALLSLSSETREAGRPLLLLHCAFAGPGVSKRDVDSVCKAAVTPK